MDDNSRDSTLHGLGPELRRRLDRWLEGRASPEDGRIVEAWLAEDPGRRELIRRIQQASRVARVAPELWNVNEAWPRLVASAEGEARAEVVALRPRRARRRRGALAATLRIAAGVVALVGGIALWQQRTTLFGPREVVLEEIATEVGEHMRVTLDDGTEIVLGSVSRLWIPSHFTREREVRLEGEAVFDVAPDPARPFLVRTDRAVTRVLGTSFGVRAFAEDDYVEVVVAEGRVAVVPSDSAATERPGTSLTAGHAVRVDAAGTLGAIRSVDAERLLAWTSGRLVFDEVPLREVVRRLERRFGTRIGIADPAIAQRRLTADFEPTANAAEVVRLITRSLGIEFRRSPEGLLLYPPVATAEPDREGEPNR